MIQIADSGYDVWVGSVRGTEYSMAHNDLTPNDPEFWNFTWDDIARFDIPAMI